ncbi:NTP transferase domain-containing protein [Cohnella sp. LGH]|nr:NTP transferase domain-containing protein [Cohnella sp. LGH]
MKIVLLSGGSGRRLWPLSNAARSKQFLRILRNPHGEMESMVQRVWRQLGAAGLKDQCTIVTGTLQADTIRRQLGDEVQLLVEPESRDTYPAIALAAAYLHSVCRVAADEAVIVLPVDPYVDDLFFEKLKELETMLSRTSADLGLVGVTPTYPSTKYGYIVPEVPEEAEASGFFEAAEGSRAYGRVASFHEKPAEAVASRLIEERKALWNCGVFAFRLGYMAERIRQAGLPFQYEKLIEDYRRLPKTSFDFEVVETCGNIAMMVYDGYWKDLGTWNTLTEEMGVAQIGKGTVSPDSRNTHLINEIHIPVTVLGLSNIVVAVSPDGILVTDKEASPRLKELLEGVQSPMYVEYDWGTSRVLDYERIDENNEIVTKRLTVAAGKRTDAECAPKRETVWTIVSGRGEALLDGVSQAVGRGSVLRISAKQQVSFEAFEDSELIEIQTGSPSREEGAQRRSYPMGSAVI